MRCGLKWAGLPPALLLGSLASFAISPPMKESPRVATDAAEIRADFPQLFGRSHFDTEATPKSAATYSDPGGACGGSSFGLCYDVADRRIVFTPARHYMPKLDGFTAESISLRRNAIRFKYSFP